MKKFIQLVCLIVVLSTCLTLPVSAEADYRASNYFMSHGGYLWWTSGTSFQVWVDVTAVGMMDEIGVNEIKVQESTDGTNWSTVATYGKMVDYDTWSYENYITYSKAVSGRSYRANITFYAKNGSGSAIYTYYAY